MPDNLTSDMGASTYVTPKSSMPDDPRKFSFPHYKKGGRVTGIAKRGFGRALMKGKK